jgi:hypothetical protein
MGTVEGTKGKQGKEQENDGQGLQGLPPTFLSGLLAVPLVPGQPHFPRYWWQALQLSCTVFILPQLSQEFLIFPVLPLLYLGL